MIFVNFNAYSAAEFGKKDYFSASKEYKFNISFILMLIKDLDHIE